MSHDFSSAAKLMAAADQPGPASDPSIAAQWAVGCGERVLNLYEARYPTDPRARDRLARGRALLAGEEIQADSTLDHRAKWANRAIKEAASPTSSAAAAYLAAAFAEAAAHHSIRGDAGSAWFSAGLAADYGAVAVGLARGAAAEGTERQAQWSELATRRASAFRSRLPQSQSANPFPMMLASDDIPSLNAIPLRSAEDSWVGRTLGVDAVYRVRLVLQVLGLPLRPVNALRLALNRVPVRILSLGFMRLGDWLLLISVAIIVALVLHAGPGYTSGSRGGVYGTADAFLAAHEDSSGVLTIDSSFTVAPAAQPGDWIVTFHVPYGGRSYVCTFTGDGAGHVLTQYTCQ